MIIAPASTTPDTAPFVEQIYRPMLKGYFGLAAIYYMVLTLVHFGTESGTNLLVIATASSVASMVFAGSWWAIGNAVAIARVPVFITIANLLMLANVMLAMEIGFAQENLIYFILMVMIFSLACTSIRQALVSTVPVLAGLYYVLQEHAPEEMVLYGFVTFAAVLGAMSITFFLRRALGLTAFAKHEAENRLQEAQDLGEKMRHRSLSDSLTGLPNRRAFFETFNESKTEAESGVDSWLVLLDLDGFKAVNDGHGHSIGDELLRQAATRMRDYCGGKAYLSRIGGDEFNIILPDMSEEAVVDAWCQGLLEYIARVYLIEDRLIQISASMGCQQINPEESDAQLIRDADYALLHAKKNGKNKVVVFRDEHARVAAERYKIERALRGANFAAEIELLFQPQFDLGHERIVRAEALARWTSPTLGAVMPGRFIEIAEESGLIANITLVVVEKALAALKSWDDPIPLSVNLSGNDLLSDHIIARIIDKVEGSGLDPALLEFEITETAMMADTGKATRNMLRLSERGHPLALDDFGTGYSNFNYLRELPISKLKVDRSFLTDVGDPMTEKILHSLVGMARTLGIDCLFEGVEDEIQLIIAKRAGTHLVQGYLFGKPMTGMQLLCAVDEHNDEHNRVPPRQAGRNALGG